MGDKVAERARRKGREPDGTPSAAAAPRAGGDGAAQRLRLGVAFRVLDRLYRWLGSAYPTVVLAFVLMGAVPVAIVSTLVLRLYVERMSHAQFLTFLGVAIGVALLTVAFNVLRGHLCLRPFRRWRRGARGDAETQSAWEAVVALPGLQLRSPLFSALFVMGPLTAAGAVILDLPWEGVVALFAGVFVTVGYGTALNYFALESMLRPVVADVAGHLPREADLGMRESLRVKLLAALPLVNVITGVVVAGITSRSDQTGIAALGVGVLVATAVAFTISLVLTLRVSAAVARPVGELQRASELVEQGNFDVTVPVTSADEIGGLARSFNRMVAGLAERERIREAFGTYVDHGVAEQILTDDDAMLEGEEVEVTVLFLDIRDFTSFAHRAPAPEVVSTLNRLFERVVPIVHEHGGHVDKFIGDGLLAVFGAPERHPDHAARALSAAREIVRQAEEALGGELEIGVGLNSGPVVAGSIGGAGRLNFSVIGDAVNVAARVEAATRRTGDRILLTERTRELLADEGASLAERHDIELRGVPEPVTLYAPQPEG
jgi:class 3 adenylate cyclase